MLSLPALRRIPRGARSLASPGRSFDRTSPENFIKTNPQTNTAVYETNLGHANYHSWQTQLSVRPIAGVSTQVTYTWSRNLGQVPGEGPNGTGALFTDPTDRAGGLRASGQSSAAYSRKLRYLRTAARAQQTSLLELLRVLGAAGGKLAVELGC